MLTATMAASVLAIGLSSAQSLAARDNAAAPDSAVRLAQQKDMGPGGPGGPGPTGPSTGPAQGPAVGPGPRGGKMRGEGGAQFRSGERGMGYGPRAEERSREWTGRDRDRGQMRRPYGRRGLDVGPGFGYVADCGWLRRRALDTGSRYWWRRYRACVQ
jgi:hypothetical protein